jgi:threonine/homoserine/homoserine lactone efflux protein
MSVEIWLGFVLASAVLLVIPGPTLILVTSRALAGGRHTAWWTVPGVALGDLTALTLSAAGLGAVLAASATLFTIIKLAGAAYLAYLGLKLWRSADTAPEAQIALGRGRGRTLFLEAYAVTALNPKSIIFFVAFVPQFITPAWPMLPQLAVLIPTFVALAAVNATAFALLASSLRTMGPGPGMRRWLDRLGGSILIGAAAMMAAWRRAA